jgi:HEAT repeat protein
VKVGTRNASLISINGPDTFDIQSQIVRPIQTSFNLIQESSMTTNTSVNDSKIENLVSKFSDEDGLIREQARNELVEIGSTDVTRALVIELNDPRRDVRWEAGKSLISIGDPIAASALVHHLSDENGDIRWLAAEGLSVLGRAGLLATLNASMRNAQSSEFCHAAHHAFKKFKKIRQYAEILDPVIDACEASEPGVSLPVAAYQVLQQIKVNS